MMRWRDVLFYGVLLGVLLVGMSVTALHLQEKELERLAHCEEAMEQALPSQKFLVELFCEVR